MADENYAIKVSFTGVEESIADFNRLQNVISNIKAPAFNIGDSNSTELVEASLKKIQLEIDALEEKKAKSAANDALRADILAAKQEANAQRESQRESDSMAKKESNNQKVLDQLEKQLAASNVRVTQGGNEGSDKESKFTAQNLQEALRYKQQLAAIDKAGFSAADAQNAKELASGINSLNLQKIEQDFEKINTGQRNFTGNLRDSAELLGIAAQKVKEFQQEASAAYAEQRKSQGALSTQATDAKGLGVALKDLAIELKNQVSTADLTANSAKVAQQGYRDTKDNVDVLRASQKLAIAEQIDFNQSLGITSTVLKAYNLPASDAAKVTDQLVATARAAKVPVSELGSQYDKLASTASGTGTKFEQLNSFIANAASQGITAKTSVGALNQALDSLQSGDFVKKGRELGIVFDEQKLKSGGLQEALKQLKAQGFDQNSVALNTLFGSAKNVQAVMPSLQKGLNTVSDAAGIVNKNFETVSGYNKAEASANQLKDALAEIGAAIAPFTLAVTNVLRGISSGFAQLDPNIKGIIGTIAGLVGAGFAASAVITGTLAVITPTIGAFKLLALAISEKTTADVSSTASAGASTTATAAQGTAAGGASVGFKALSLSMGTVALAAAAIAAVGNVGSILAQRFNTASTTKSLDELSRKLDEIEAKRGKIKPDEDQKNSVKKEDNLGASDGNFVFDPFGQTLGRQKEVIAFADSQKILNKVFDEGTSVLSKYGLTQKDAADRSRLGAEGIKNFSEAARNQVENIDTAIQSLQSQSAANPEIAKQANAEIALLSQQKASLEDRVKFVNSEEIPAAQNVLGIANKSAVLSKEQTEELKKQAIAKKDAQNQDSERGIKRNFDDGKAKRDIESANAVKAVEERNAISKGELDRKQALETESLKERQTLALQDKQRTFDDAQNAKKLAGEDTLDAKKRANDLRQQAVQQAFDDSQNRVKEDRANKQRQDDEKFANARAERDKKNSESSSGAKQLIADESKIATAKPEERAKIAQKVQEEQRIRTDAKSQGTGGEQTQEQLLAKAKQIAQVQAIATAEEQAKVQLALDELEKANKAKQSELDKAEDAKRSEEKRASDKAFDELQKTDKRAFDVVQKADTLAFEQTILKPEKLKLEKELQADKLLFERGELAALKRTQATEEKALKLQQETADVALKKASEAEIAALKATQKESELAKDRVFEDAKIERDRTFKESQRALDKASAIEIQQIMGQSAKQIIDAIAVAKGASSLSAAAGVGKTPAFASGVTNFVGGTALVGEKGAELVNLPRGSNVIPANQTKQILTNNSGGNKNYTINVQTGSGDGVAIGSQIQRELARSAALNSGL